MMQRHRFHLLCASLLFLGLVSGHGGGVLEAHPPTARRVVDLSPTQVRVVEGPGADRVELEGGISAFPVGAPDLPVLPVFVLLPEGTEAASVRVTALETRPAGIALPLAAVAPPEAALETPRTAVEPASVPKRVPSDLLHSFATGRMRGRNVAVVTVAPVSWEGDTGQLQLATRFRVEVDLHAAEPHPGDFRVRRESRAGRRGFSSALRALTGIAPDSPDTGLLGQSASGAPFAPTFRPTEDGSPVDMVIITTAEQESVYVRLAEFHTRTGISTVVRTVDWILQNYPRESDVAETIRSFIRDAAAAWGTAYVLVGGDTDAIPIRYTRTVFGTPGGEEIPTDLYYSDLDGNWDADGDGYYGEAEFADTTSNDHVDLFPDVWVGRLPSTDAATAAVMVDKTLNYLSNPPPGYVNGSLLLGEVLFPSNWAPGQAAYYDGAEMCEDVVGRTPPSGRLVRLYENSSAWPGSLPETKEAVRDSINAGFGLVHHVGHGYINTMSMGLGGKTFSNSDVDQLQNGDRTFLLYAVNCTSCAVDFNCIGERFLLNPGGGAVAACGVSRSAYALTSWDYQNEFYRLLYDEGVTDLGRTLALSRLPFIPSSQVDNETRWTQFTLIYMGDPALGFWTEDPRPLTVVHAATAFLGSDTFTVSVEREGLPLPGAEVTLFKEDDAYSVGFTNAAGQITFPFDVDEPGTLSVGAVASGSLPYLSPVAVIAPSDPVLSPSGQYVVDDGSGSTNGNGDGRIDAGETVELRFDLRNSGANPAASPVQAELAISDPRVSVADSVSAYPPVPPGGPTAPLDPMLLAFDRSIPDRSEIHGTLTITRSGGTSQHDVILYVGAPMIELRELAVRDTIGSGDGDGVPETGEDLVLLPRLRNLGLGTLHAAELRLRTNDPNVTISDSVSVLGDLMGGETRGNPYDGLTLSLGGADPASVNLLLAVLDAYGEVMTVAVDLIPPPAPVGLAAFGEASSIRLRWAPVASPGLWGYNVYRGPAPAGPLKRLNPAIWGRSSTYEDDGLPGLTQYVYAVSAVDSSGNEGPLSPTILATTSLPQHPGWPVEVGVGTPSGVAIADLDADGQVEILGGGDEIYAVRADGSDYHDGDQEARTLGPLTDTNGAGFWNVPAVGDVDGDGEVEVAAPSWDGLLRLVDHLGSPLPGWPRSVNALSYQSPNPIGSACLADLDLDGNLEVLCAVGKVIYAWKYTGDEVADGDNDPATDGVLAVTGANFSYGTPSVGNIDGDPYPEILVGMRDGNLYVLHHDGSPYPGFPFVTGGDISSGPALGDIDLDGRIEIVFASSDGHLYALRADGTVPVGFPVSMPFDEDWDPSPALGDLDGDGYLDVVIPSSDGLLHALHGESGLPLAGFPFAMVNELGQPVSTRSSPVLADLDGDGGLDVALGDQLGRILAISHTGTLLKGFPLQTGNTVAGSIAVWDVDRDGYSEVIAQSADQEIYVWDTPWIFSPSRAVWPMFKRNARHTGDVRDEGPSTVGATDPPLPVRLLLAQNVPNPFRASTRIRYSVPPGATQDVELRVFDLSGRSVRRLVVDAQPPGEYETTWDGTDDAGRPVASGMYAYWLRVGHETRSRKMVLLK